MVKLLTETASWRRVMLTQVIFAALISAVAPTQYVAAAPNFSSQVEIAKAIGIPKNSKFYDSFFEPRTPGAKTPAASKLQALDVKSTQDAKAGQIIRHFRGSAGRPFTVPPTTEQILAGSKLTADNARKILDIAKDSWKFQAQLLPTPPKVMPTCMLNKTEKVAIPKTPKTQANQLIFDYLFIPKDDLPIDPAKAFGKRTSVFEYETAEHASAFLALAVKATCIPYRIRVTGKYIYRHFGLNALYNFDQQYDGKGKLDKSIALKFKKVKK